MSAPRPAVFLDRDGVINDVIWRGGKPASPRSLDELNIAPGVPAALKALKASGFLLFAVTNQPDIRRGLMSQPALDAIHRRLADALPLDEIVACRHDDRDGCDCRKPKPGMLLDLAQRWGVDLSASWMVGDQDRDIACARAAGCGALLIGRDYNTRAGADHVAADITDIADFLLSPASRAAVS